MVKCSEVLRYSDGLSNKVSNIIRRHIDNMKLLYLYVFYYYHILSYSSGSIFYQCIYSYIPVQYCNLCTFIVMSMYSYLCLCMFIVPAGTLRLP